MEFLWLLLLWSLGGFYKFLRVVISQLNYLSMSFSTRLRCELGTMNFSSDCVAFWWNCLRKASNSSRSESQIVWSFQVPPLFSDLVNHLMDPDAVGLIRIEPNPVMHATQLCDTPLSETSGFWHQCAQRMQPQSMPRTVWRMDLKALPARASKACILDTQKAARVVIILAFTFTALLLIFWI